MFFTLGYLAHLERLGVPVVNGLKAFRIETSKARQLTLLNRSACRTRRRGSSTTPPKRRAAARGCGSRWW